MPIEKRSTNKVELRPAFVPCAAVVLVLALLPSLLEGQVNSRAELIQQARREKAQTLHPPVQGGLEKAMLRAEEANFVQRLTAGLPGLRAQFGGLAFSHRRMSLKEVGGC